MGTQYTKYNSPTEDSMALNNSGHDIGVILPGDYGYSIHEPREEDVGDFYEMFYRYGSLELHPPSYRKGNLLSRTMKTGWHKAKQALGLEDKLPEQTIVPDGVKMYEYEGAPELGGDRRPTGGYFAQQYPEHRFYRPGDSYESLVQF